LTEGAELRLTAARASTPAVGLELGHLGGGHRVEDRQAAVVGGDRMVGRGDGLAGPPDGRATGAEAGESLRAGDLVDEVEIDRQDAGRARLLGDEMVVPDLVDEGSGSGGRGVGHRVALLVVVLGGADGVTEAS
jgi:hypothetical protein